MIDLHYDEDLLSIFCISQYWQTLLQDLDQHDVSQCFNRCEKIWILFSPTSENLAVYARTVDFDCRFVKINSKLQEGIIIRTTQVKTLVLLFNALYVTYIIVSSFLSEILFSAAETLLTMSCMLLNHLFVLAHIMSHFLKDLKTYTHCLWQVLTLKFKDLLCYALCSWIDLSLKLKHMLKSTKSELSAVLFKPLSVITQLWESFFASMHYDFFCSCESYKVDIESHIKQSHTKINEFW